MQRLLLIGSRAESEIGILLSATNYEVLGVAAEAEAILACYNRFRPDLLVLEPGPNLLLPEQLRRLLRSRLVAQPVPLLALINNLPTYPLHTLVGADDFMSAPYRPDELLTRIQILLWRFRQTAPQNGLRSGGLVVDAVRHLVTIEGQLVPMTLREFQLLLFLITHHDRSFSREALLLQVWGYSFDGDSRVVDAYVKRVRGKLGPNYCKQIQTLRGVGYRFNHTTRGSGFGDRDS